MNAECEMKLQRLEEPAILNEYVQPIALPSSCAPSGTMCLTSGWGNTMSSVTGGMFFTLICVPSPSALLPVDVEFDKNNFEKHYKINCKLWTYQFSQTRTAIGKTILYIRFHIRFHYTIPIQ